MKKTIMKLFKCQKRKSIIPQAMQTLETFLNILPPTSNKNKKNNTVICSCCTLMPCMFMYVIFQCVLFGLFK